MSTQFVIQFSSDLPEEGLHDPDVSEKGKKSVVMEMLRKGIISQGRAAELLEIDRYALLDLMAEYDVPVINMTLEELKAELR